SGTVATFSDPAGAEAAGDYTATINWGDGSAPQNGAITAYGIGSGTHTYAEESAADHLNSDPYTISVVVHHEGTDSNTAASTVHVNEVAVVASGVPAFTIDEGGAVTGTVATFTDPAGYEADGDYSAMIDWGDGSAPTAGLISNGSV